MQILPNFGHGNTNNKRKNRLQIEKYNQFVSNFNYFI